MRRRACCPLALALTLFSLKSSFTLTAGRRESAHAIYAVQQEMSNTAAPITNYEQEPHGATGPVVRRSPSPRANSTSIRWSPPTVTSCTWCGASAVQLTTPTSITPNTSAAGRCPLRPLPARPTPACRHTRRPNTCLTGQTAKVAYATAQNAAASWRGDAMLLAATATWSQGAGRSELLPGANSWVFTFYAPGSRQTAVITIVGGQVTLVSEGQVAPPSSRWVSCP